MKRRALTIAAAVLSVLAMVLCCIGLFPLKHADNALAFKGAGIPAADAAPVQRPDGTVDINSNDIEDLTMLRGVGESLAERIIAERILNGSYHYPEDLYAVSGIGASKVNGFRDQLDFSWEEP